MAAKGDIEVVGLGKVEKEIKAVSDALLRPTLLKGLRVGAAEFRKEVRKRTPKRKGALLKALRVRAHKGKNDRSWASVGVSFKKNTYQYKGKIVNPFYGIMIHNGTIVGEDGKRIRFKSYKSKAYDGFSGFQKAAQRQHDRQSVQGRQRIAPNPFLYEAFMEAAPKAAEKSLNKLIELIEK